MSSTGSQFKWILRISAACAVVTALVLVVQPQTQAGATQTSQTDQAQTEPTPEENAAIRGCIEGIAVPSEQDLSFAGQLAACNALVALSQDEVGARYMRALILIEDGTTDAHRRMAFDDLTATIESGAKNPSAFNHRAWMLLRDHNAPERALADMDAAIKLTSGRPRARYFERRAIVLLQIAERDWDDTYVTAALKDIREAKALKPDNARAEQIESWAETFLKQLLLDGGQDIQKL